jgi:hypothetical protein
MHPTLINFFSTLVTIFVVYSFFGKTPQPTNPKVHAVPLELNACAVIWAVRRGWGQNAEYQGLFGFFSHRSCPKDL